MNSTVEIKVINKSSNPLPCYATAGSAGVDVRAFISSPVIIKPLQRCAIPTGLFIQLPVGYEAQIRPRSGIAFRNGVTVLNSPGTIDSDYRGEINVILINLSSEDYVVNNGDRICQMVIAHYESAIFHSVEFIDETVRGDGKFGHTGIK